MVGDLLTRCSICDHELTADDLFCPACDELVLPEGAVEVPVGRADEPKVVDCDAARTHGSGRRGRRVALALAALLVAGGIVAGSTPWGGSASPQTLPAPVPAVAPTDGAVLEHFELLRATETSELPTSGASHLALRDDTTLRWLELDTGRLSGSEAVGTAAVPIEPIPGGILAVDVSAGVVKAVSPNGPLWTSDTSGDVVVGTDGTAHWQSGWAGSMVLTRHQGSTETAAERINLPRWGVLVGFFDGRPVTQVRGVIAVETESLGTKVVTRGFPLAQAADWLVYRPCTTFPCDAPAVRRNLATGHETPARLGPTTTAHGVWGSELSPDGRHLVTVSYGVTPRISVTNLDTGRALQVPQQLLGTVGEPALFEWSPNGRLLAAAGAEQLAIFDLQTDGVVVAPFVFDGRVNSLAWVPLPLP